MSNDIEHLYMRLFMPSMCGQPISRPVRCGAKWESGVKMQIPESREEAVEEVRSVRHEVQVYSDGSGIGSGIGAAVVLFRNGEEKCTLRKYQGKEGEHTVFEAEVMGLALAAELVREDTHGCSGDQDQQPGNPASNQEHEGGTRKAPAGQVPREAGGGTEQAWSGHC